MPNQSSKKTKSIRKKTRDITDIYMGQSIRGQILADPTGKFRIVQIKDINKDNGIIQETLYRTHLTGRAAPRLLKKGDLLFVSRVFRGSLPYAALVDVDLPNLVAAPTFQILSVKENLVRSEYLQWFINSEFHGGRFFKQNAMGGSVLNIPKSVLNEMEIILPPLEEQDRFIKLIKAAAKEKEIMQTLIEKRRVFMDGILNKFSEL